MDILRLEVSKLWGLYNFYLERADPRVQDWLLMDSYHPTIILTILYLVFVKLGMRMMEERKPIPCQWFIRVYNLALILLNVYISYELLSTSLAQEYNFYCQPVDYSNNPLAIRTAKVLWWFYFSKLIEFSDTFFFIARKKNNQITFLHVYHHATMFPIWWIGIKWVPGGQSVLGALINASIHVCMYMYYFLSSLGPSLTPFLWWKRYLTILQLIQFVVGILHASQSIYFGCDFPLWMHWALVIYGLSIFTLFVNFYLRTYLNKAAVATRSYDDGGCGVKNGGGVDDGESNSRENNGGVRVRVKNGSGGGNGSCGRSGKVGNGEIKIGKNKANSKKNGNFNVGKFRGGSGGKGGGGGSRGGGSSGGSGVVNVGSNRKYVDADVKGSADLQGRGRGADGPRIKKKYY